MGSTCPSEGGGSAGDGEDNIVSNRRWRGAGIVNILPSFEIPEDARGPWLPGGRAVYGRGANARCLGNSTGTGTEVSVVDFDRTYDSNACFSLQPQAKCLFSFCRRVPLNEPTELCKKSCAAGLRKTVTHCRSDEVKVLQW